MSLFDEVLNTKTGKIELKPYDFRNAIGQDRDMADIDGYDRLTDQAQELLKYLLRNHSNETDKFIHAIDLTKLLKLQDTRTLRKLCAEIDHKTELIVYASQQGYKLASTDIEIRNAIKFALAPVMTSIRRVFAKNKKETLHWLHGFIGNLEKEYGGYVSGQKQFDENGNIREVKHLPPEREMPEYVYDYEEIKEMEKGFDVK